MSGWIWWLLVACGFAVGEVTLTAGFWLAPGALGAGVAAAVDAAGAPTLVTFAAFVVVTLTALFSLRPLVASRLLHSTPLLRTGGAALVGRHGTVIDPISPPANRGSVRIGGEVWSASAYDERSEIAAGTDVEVVAISGATALVME